MEKKLKELVLWFLAAVFLTWGWQLLGTAYLVVALISLGVAGGYVAVESTEESKVKADDFVYLCLAIGVAEVASAMAETLWVGIVVLIVFCFLVWKFERREEKTVILVVGSVVVFFIASFTVLVDYTPAYMNDKEAYKRWFVKVAYAQIPQERKEEIEANPFILKLENNFMKDEIRRLDSLTRANQDSTSAVLNRIRKIRAKEINEELAKFKGKTEILKIKRMWLTSDVLPWTYSMWKTIEYSLSLDGNFSARSGGMFSRGGGGSFNVSGKVTPNINGESNYVGNSELSYINILFSDNSYRRFSIKENPEWLLTREGERARVEYRVKYADEKSLSLEDLVESRGFISKTYVPLFK